MWPSKINCTWIKEQNGKSENKFKKFTIQKNTQNFRCSPVYTKEATREK